MKGQDRKIRGLDLAVSRKVWLLLSAAEYLKYRPSLLAFESEVGKEEAIRLYRERLFSSR